MCLFVFYLLLGSFVLLFVVFFRKFGFVVYFLYMLLILFFGWLFLGGGFFYFVYSGGYWGFSIWIGYLIFVEDFMEENFEGLYIRFDGVMFSGECFGRRLFVGDVVVIGKVDVFL